MPAQRWRPRRRRAAVWGSLRRMRLGFCRWPWCGRLAVKRLVGFDVLDDLREHVELLHSCPDRLLDSGQLARGWIGDRSEDLLSPKPQLDAFTGRARAGDRLIRQEPEPLKIGALP